MLPLVYFVSSPGGLGMKYKVTHVSTQWTRLHPTNFSKKTFQDLVRNQSRSRILQPDNSVKTDQGHGISGQYSFSWLRNNLKMRKNLDKAHQAIKWSWTLTSRSTRQVFVNYQVYEISRNSNGGPFWKRGEHPGESTKMLFLVVFYYHF